MASNGVPVSATLANIVQGSQVSPSIPISARSGKVLPAGNPTASIEAASAAARASAHAAASRSAPNPADQAPAVKRSNLQTLVAQLNKYLNDSGRPDQFRVDPQSASMIQEVNPSNGVVIGEFSASEFPALARSVGASGLLVDSRA